MTAMSRRSTVIALAVVLLVGVVLWFWRSGDTQPSPLNVTPVEASAQTPQAQVQPAAQFQKPVKLEGDAGPQLPVPAGTQTLATFGWGSGPQQLGRSRPQEGNPEAPMSLTVDKAGTVMVLDQLNNRLVRIDKNGQALPPIPLTLQAPQDVVTAADGTVLVSDRLVDKAVAVMRDGKQVGELPLEGKGITEGGAVSGIFTSGTEVYAEREHGDLVTLGTTAGARSTERTEVPGRPTRDGKGFISANIVDAPGGLALVTAIDRPSLSHRFSRSLPLGSAISSLVLLDSDAAGVIFLGAMVAGQAQNEPLIRVLCLDPLDGRPIGRAELPANMSADETFRELAIGDDGSITYLQRTESGAQLLRATCR